MATAHWKGNICARDTKTLNERIHICDSRLCLPRMASPVSTITVCKLCSMSGAHRDPCQSMYGTQMWGKGSQLAGVSNAAQRQTVSNDWSRCKVIYDRRKHQQINKKRPSEKVLGPLHFFTPSSIITTEIGRLFAKLKHIFKVLCSCWVLNFWSFNL